MKVDYSGFKKETIPLVLLSISAVFAALILIKATNFFAGSAQAEGLVRRAVVQSSSSEEQIGGVIARSCAVADELKEANFFSPPEPRRHPVTSVMGILGDEVLIESRWYKAGDRIQDARVIAVEATQVRIEWDGREKTFAPLQTTDRLDSGRSRRTSRSSRLIARASGSARRPPEMIQIGQGSSRSVLSAEDREELRQKAEKQRLSIANKELQRASKKDANKSKSDKKKKSSDEIKKTREKATDKRAKKLPRK